MAIHDHVRSTHCAGCQKKAVNPDSSTFFNWGGAEAGEL